MGIYKQYRLQPTQQKYVHVIVKDMSKNVHLSTIYISCEEETKCPSVKKGIDILWFYSYNGIKWKRHFFVHKSHKHDIEQKRYKRSTVQFHLYKVKGHNKSIVLGSGWWLPTAWLVTGEGWTARSGGTAMPEVVFLV